VQGLGEGLGSGEALGSGEGGGGKGGGGGGEGSGSKGGGGAGGAACAQTSHPLRVTLPSEDHVKEALPSNASLGPVVPSYVTPFTISLSKPLSVVKAVALKS
jgi:hypothetical protein